MRQEGAAVHGDVTQGGAAEAGQEGDDPVEVIFWYCLLQFFFAFLLFKETFLFIKDPEEGTGQLEDDEVQEEELQAQVIIL